MRHNKFEYSDAWRKLKELEPIQSFWCRIGFHKWTNWEVYQAEWAHGSPSHAICYCARCGMPRVESPVTGKKKNG